MRLPNSIGILVLITCGWGFWAIWSHDIGLGGFIASLATLIGWILWHNFNYSMISKKWLERASIGTIVLAPPFNDRWIVAAGGPDPRHNHHHVASDQLYAYDFLREDGDSWDQPILAPVDGMIAHVESRQVDAAPDARQRDRKRPFGNYISIQTPKGYVILAHLKQGSISVRVGDHVKCGTEIARCGNSGNTLGAHLHLHAQDQPSQNVGVANGVPVAFTDRLRTEPLLLEYHDTLG